MEENNQNVSPASSVSPVGQTPPIQTPPVSNPSNPRWQGPSLLKMAIGIILFLLIAGSAAGFYVFKQQSLKIVKPIPASIVQIQTPTPNPTADWKKYENNEFGFTFTYPSTYDVNGNPLSIYSFLYEKLYSKGADPGGICRFPCFKTDLDELKLKFDTKTQLVYAPYLDKGKYINISNHTAVQTIWYDSEGGKFLITTSFLTDKGLFGISQDLLIDNKIELAKKGIATGSQEYINYNGQLASNINAGNGSESIKNLINTHNQILSTFQFTN